ncbi:hypothetical protein GCM10011578_032140 [Streptomyces fuscichromogenes]|uniref:Uncharacterized protein n=1 Tax=Streptomyces fuscichromogenes TaxID=1324013 RepID=A0A917XCG5_9ACTN|nr:hypothetical protein GCM10011578_032140 [Streptomyces fuscichromogenes]
MWFTGRVSGAATVLVTDPSQVTGRPAAAGVFDAEVPAAEAGVEVPDTEDEDEAADETGEGEEECVAGVPAVATSSARTPVPSEHAVRDNAASTTVVAAPTRRVREVREARRSDMWLCPFGVRVAVVIG